MARKRFWLAVAPITYAVTIKAKEKMGVFRRHIAQNSCSAITARTQYFVHGSGPQSLVTYIELVSVRMQETGFCYDSLQDGP